MFLRLAWQSLLSRKGSALLTLFAITVSVFVLLGVEQLRHQARNSFGNTVSGVDLIVGARTGNVNLLLYSVFHLGNATNNVRWQSYQSIADNPAVDWTIPLSLGDSHKGYRVVGTTAAYFQHFRYAQGESLRFGSGEAFSKTLDVVLGSDVARDLNYHLGDQLVLAHGMGTTSFSKHDDNPFSVSGILKPTGTPVDRALYVSLGAIEAIHEGWQHGVKLPDHLGNQANQHHSETPDNITAFMVGLESKMATFGLQRQINNYRGEPLQAILPGVTLSQLWDMMSVMETSLRLISALVLLAALLGLAAMLLTSIRERQREMAVLRAIGASPWFLLALIEMEALIISLGASLLAVALLWLSTSVAGELLAERFSLFLDGTLLSPTAISYLLAVLGCSLLIALIPGISAYRQALHQQLNN
ncbi:MULTISPECIES: ABC transporter permease [Spongiibacter]|uniref:ABC transporter permease n=1 Tax=Spongiibacter TaxID=630749 RepID=UPI000C5E0D32|nr:MULTISPECIES: ABC transporter permease [Spongiibacter]MAY38191.1 peptide ABC transporter permease [Spongiibacter sp.]|tara:strand:+ start:45429 stop:46676 length:1248 start_codon:yes stop_codon:yes gene_type:complete